MNEVIIRKPTDDEQRMAKIATSDYLISALTIHSSVLNTLGFIDKVYRSKQTIVNHSNKNEIKSLKKNIKYLIRTFGSKMSSKDIFNFSNEVKANKSFVKMLI
jgi:hypothetical protein